MSSFQPSSNTRRIEKLENQLKQALSENKQLKTERQQAEKNLEHFRKQSAHTIEKLNNEHLDSLRASREQTAAAREEYNTARIRNRQQMERYLKNLTSQRNQLALVERNASQGPEPTRPITSSRGRRGFLTNMKKAMAMMMKRPATAFTALTAALAALGMTVIQQQQQLNQHRLDIQRIQNDYFNQLNKTNYYRDAFLGRAKIQTPSQYAGGGSVSRVLNSKNRAKHRKKIQDEANRIGPPPGKG